MGEANQSAGQYSHYRILIVDSDSKYRKVIEGMVSAMGFSFISTGSVESSKEILKAEKVDLCLCELRMPHESGIDLVNWVRRVYDSSFRKHMPLPFLLMTGFVHLFQQEEHMDLFIDEVLIKPLDEEELKKAILMALKIKNPTDHLPEAEKLQKEEEDAKKLMETHEKDYCRVLLSDFVSHPILEMDVFVQLSQDKFVCIARKGEELNSVQFRRYKDKGIEFLYIKKEEFRKIVDFNMKLNRVVSKASQFSLEKKKRFMAKTGEIILENAFVNGINQEVFDTAKEFLCTSIETLMEDEETASLLEILNDHSDALYAHSLGVSIYSVMIAQQMEWNSEANLFKLSFGALMHDIGKKDFDPTLLEKPKAELTFEEKVLLETHPWRAKEILENLKSVPSEVIAIAYEHHENAMGQGYPRCLKKNRISPMARIVGVADEFCYFAIKNPDHPGADAKTAFQLLNQYKYNMLDPDSLAALKKVIHSGAKKKGA